MELTFYAKLIMKSEKSQDMQELKRLCDKLLIEYPEALENFLTSSQSYLFYKMEKIGDDRSEMRIPLSSISKDAEFIVFEIRC